MSQSCPSTKTVHWGWAPLVQSKVGNQETRAPEGGCPMDTDTASVVSDPGHRSHGEGKRTLVHGGPREPEQGAALGGSA